MRRYWREQRPTSMFRGAELLRLLTGIFMLFLIVMLVMRFRDPSMWRWVDRRPPAIAPGPTRQPPKSLPAATGPTDEDPDEAEEARNEFQVVVDGALQIQQEEMEPYDRLVEWVKNQSFERLYQRATKGTRYTNLYDEAERRRGELVALNLEVRIAEDVGKNRYGVPLHAVWGVTDESRGRLYSLIVVDYPPGMPVGFNIQTKAKFAGYFLKLQGYEPGSAKPGQAPEKAPLLIGRLLWEPTPVAEPPIDTAQEWIWGVGLLAVIGFVLGLRWGYYKWFRRKSTIRMASPDAARGEVIPIEQWLERAEFGPHDDGHDGDVEED